MDLRRSAASAWVVIAFVFASQTFAAAGRTPGSPNVSDTGEASYAVPIFTPPGTNGMTPGLALVYGHRSSNTSLGAGWGISGLSTITRCAKIWAADGELREPRNDYSDRFCLDGNKLRRTSGTYGNAGATYQTELETFVRVTSNGVAGNGPASFTVVDRNGNTHEYGHTSDSRIESVGQSTVRAWALNKIRDPSGNAITFTYAEDTVNGSYRIELIQYTTNPGQGVTTPAYDVDFIWQGKPAGEVASGYMAGSVIKEVNRLDRINVNSGATLVRRYELTYEGSLSSTMKSRLASIQECAGSPLDCLSSTTFVYQNGTAGFASEVNTAVAVPTTPWPIDVNADGRDDLVYSSSATSGSGTWKVMFANTSGGYNAPVDTGVTNTNYAGATPIDYNGDGFGDLLVPYSAGTWWVMTGSASGLAAPVDTFAPATVTGTSVRVMDVTGDGLEDLVWADHVGYSGGDAIRYRWRTPAGPTGFSSIQVLVAPYPADHRIEPGVFGPLGQSMARRIPDFNGDGRDDVVFRHTQRVPIDGTVPQEYTFSRSLEVVCSGGFSFTANALNAAGVLSYGDFNGDGMSDLLYLNNAGNIVARFSTGAGFTAMNTVASGSTYNQYGVLDWDHDGKEDILLTNASGTVFVARSTGESFAAPATLGFNGGNPGTVADINGDGLDDLAYALSGTWRFRVHTLTEADLLQTATDGFGNFSTFNYTSITAGNYTKGSGATFPEMDYGGALQVVSSLVASNGIGGSFTQSFWYYFARTHLQGRGFEGFGARLLIDDRNNLQTYEYRGQLFPHTGMPLETVVTQPGGTPEIMRVTNTFAKHDYASGPDARVLPYISSSTATRREVDVGGGYNAAIVSTAVTTNLVHATTGVLYDTQTVTTEAGTANGVQAGASYVQRVYQPLAFLTTNANCLGKPQQVQHINSHDQFGGGAITRTTDITWDTTACRPTQVVEESGNSLLQVTRALVYDGFGNVNSDSVTGIGMTARTTTANWGATGQFPTSVTNALSQTTNKTWNYALGVQSTETDPNGLAVGWLYDDFGRPTRENRPDGTYTTWEFYVNPICDPRYRIAVLEKSYQSTGVSNNTDRYTFFDQFGRAIDEYVWSDWSSNWMTAIRTYDALGRVATVGAPYSSGGCTSYTPNYVTSFQYDLLGRVTQVSRPTSDSIPALQTTTVYHEGLTTRVVDPLSKQSSKVANVVGGLARSIDHDGYYQSFDHDAFGNVKRVQDSLSNTLLSNTFNIRGVRTAQTDMDAGSWTLTPNALGEITSQTDAKSQNTTFVYDPLGRLTSRTEFEGTSTFTFGTSATSTLTNKNIGRLVGMAGPGYSESLTYDTLARLQQRSITSDATYNFDYAYNNQGSLDTLTYPVSTSSYRLRLQYEYQSGALLRVKDFNAPTTVFWQANAKDAWGNVIDETLGNGIKTVRGFDLATGVLDYIQSGVGGGTGRQNLGYTWDAVGNLTQRQNVGLSLTQNFGYDNLHRLTSVTAVDPITIGYNSLGNITSKTGVGSYTYHATKKHQVTAAGGSSYGYDANGNMNSRAGSSISWYSYNLPNTIGGPSSNSSQFFYGPDRSRWKQQASYAGTSEQTIYIGGLVEKVTRGGVTRWKHYIAGGTGVVAEYIRPSTGSNETVYLLKDHLGSTEMVTNSSGAQMSRLAHDAWGARRNGATWVGNPTAGEWTTITNTTRHGFTSHEMLDNLNLTHMNGRVYDQVLGRFLSADPFIDGAGSTQGWNRYSYVHNNPLSFTDPTGFAGKPPKKWINGQDSAPHWDRESVADRIGGREMDSSTFNAYFAAGVAGLNSDRRPARPLNVPDSRRWTFSPNTLPPSNAQPPGSTVSRFGNDGLMNPIYLPPGTVAMNLPNYVYQQCAMSMCHGNVALPFEKGYMTEQETRSLQLSVGITVLTLPIGGEGALLRGIPITARGLALVETNLARFERWGPNQAMVARLREAMRNGQRVSGADANFYIHEIAEGTYRARGLGYEAAHGAALGRYRMSPYSLYHPDVIAQFPGEFNAAWRAYWGLQ